MIGGKISEPSPLTDDEGSGELTVKMTHECPGGTSCDVAENGFKHKCKNLLHSALLSARILILVTPAQLALPGARSNLLGAG